MGPKRPSDGEDFMTLPFKRARINDSDEKLVSFSSVASLVGARCIDDILGCYHGSLCIPPHVEEHKLNCVGSMSFALEKDVESSAALSTVTGNLYEDESSQESDLHTVSFSFDHYPRKLVPTGREHQADVPEWEPYVGTESEQSDKTSPPSNMRTSYLGSNKNDVGKFMGTCVIQMPDKGILQCSAESGYDASDCTCVYIGSVRCVRQHVKEAQASLLKSLGRERYVDLGFLEMGEEVAHGWSDEEQQIFHEVVYMNPMSLRKNFWHCLSKKLPSRSQRDMVSYYYNVFMLRIRATQNRCHELEIDSDDDEWHGETSYSFAVHDDVGEDSQLESALDQDNGNCSDDGDHNKDFRNKVSEVDLQFLHEDMNFTRRFQCSNRGSAGCWEIFDASGCDFVPYMNMPYYSSESGSGSKCSDVSRITCYTTEGSVSVIDLGHGLYDSHESLMWGIDPFTSGLELLPTSNMIEEIFGSGSCGQKPTDDENSL